MRKAILYIIGFAALLASASCDKRAEYDQTLGLLSRYNVLPSGNGSTQVAVFSNTDWTVEMDHPVDWASIDRLGGHKSGYLVFDYEVNYGRARRVVLVFKAGDETRYLDMYQKPAIADADCILELTSEEKPTLSVSADGTTEELPFKTNLIYNLDEMYLTLQYAEGQEPEAPWITLDAVERDKVTITVLPNTTGAVRKAYVQISHTDAGSYDSTEGDTINSNMLTVIQN